MRSDMTVETPTSLDVWQTNRERYLLTLLNRRSIHLSYLPPASVFAEHDPTAHTIQFSYYLSVGEYFIDDVRWLWITIKDGRGEKIESRPAITNELTALRCFAQES